MRLNIFVVAIAGLSRKHNINGDEVPVYHWDVIFVLHLLPGLASSHVSLVAQWCTQPVPWQLLKMTESCRLLLRSCGKHLTSTLLLRISPPWEQHLLPCSSSTLLSGWVSLCCLPLPATLGPCTSASWSDCNDFGIWILKRELETSSFSLRGKKISDFLCFCNAACEAVSSWKLPKTDNIRPHLHTLHWLPFDARIKYNLFSHCLNAISITSTGHVYLSALLTV